MENIKSGIELTLNVLTETTGEQFGIRTPLLELVIRNVGLQPVMIPKEGYPLLFSLCVCLTRNHETIYHAAGGGKMVRIDTEPLPPGERKKLILSPLDDGPGESPLETGVYEVSVCIIPQSDFSYPSSFAAEFGGLQSNSVFLTVTGS